MGETPEDYRFTDLVDIDGLHGLLQSLFEATGIPHGLVDDRNDVISAIGWQQGCSDFHGLPPGSGEPGPASGRPPAGPGGLEDSAGSLSGNGLTDYAAAVVVEGRQLATLRLGPLLHAPPDPESVRRRARELGFDEQTCLEAIRKLPVIPRERIGPIMACGVQLAQMLARSGLDRLRRQRAEQRLARLNRELTRRLEQQTAELAAKNAQLAAETEERRRAEAALWHSQGRLQAVLDLSPICVGWSDRDGRVEFVDSTFTELFGYTLADIPAIEDWYRLAFPDDTFRTETVGRWLKEVAAARRANAKTPVLEAPIVCRDGSVRRAAIAVAPVGEHHWLANFSDVSDRWLAERRDQARNSVLQLIATGGTLAETLTAIARALETDSGGMICSILLLDRDGRHLRTGAAPSLPDFYNATVDGLEIGDGVGSCGTAAATRKRVVVADIQNHPYWAGYRDLAARAGVGACWSEPILAADGRLLGTFAIYHRAPRSPSEAEIQRLAQAANLASIAIEHHRVREELERQARTDFLTGLANRRRFMELAESELARSLRYGKPFCLLMLDVDHFKEVNDQHGHKMGDRVLQEIAAILRRELRVVDTAGRLGGEEFAAVLPETTVLEAYGAAERIRRAFAAAAVATETGAAIRVTVSIGIAAASAAMPIDVETLMKQADKALYAAKDGGRNQVRMAPEALERDHGPVSANFTGLAWGPGYECGHPTIDGQHRALFRQAGELLALLSAGTGRDRLLAAADGLFGELERHFEDEEAVLLASGFPDAAGHGALHRQLMEGAGERLRRFRAGELPAGELAHYLVHQLLVEHMIEEDRKFFPYLGGAAFIREL